MNLDRAAALLVSGLHPTQVATVIGCSPGRISQLLQDSSFQLLLADKKAAPRDRSTYGIEIELEDKEISSKYNATEHLLLRHMAESVQGAEFRDVTAALRVVAERQEKMKLRVQNKFEPKNFTQQSVVVSVSIPSHALPKLTMETNSNNEVISVEGQTLASLPAKAVRQLFAQNQPQNQPQNQKEGEYHEPSSASGNSKESCSSSVSAEDFLAFTTSV